MSPPEQDSSRLLRTGLCTVMLLAQACAPSDSGVPQPADIIGFAPGEDLKLANYGPIAEYFETLAASTDRMVLEQIGESTRGVPLYLAAISTPENLARMDRYKEITRTLAYARDPELHSYLSASNNTDLLDEMDYDKEGVRFFYTRQIIPATLVISSLPSLRKSGWCGVLKM